MRWKDWTNRQSVGVGLLVTALIVLVGLYGRPIALGVAAFLAVAGIYLLVGPWIAGAKAAEGQPIRLDENRTLVGEGITIVEQEPFHKVDATGAELFGVKLYLKSTVAMTSLRLWCSTVIYHWRFHFGQSRIDADSMTRLIHPEPSVLEVRFVDPRATDGATLILEIGAASPLTVRSIEPIH